MGRMFADVTSVVARMSDNALPAYDPMDFRRVSNMIVVVPRRIKLRHVLVVMCTIAIVARRVRMRRVTLVHVSRTMFRSVWATVVTATHQRITHHTHHPT